jgi:heme/copper-type cytochrome/quinol oxidase subunit 1
MDLRKCDCGHPQGFGRNGAAQLPELRTQRSLLAPDHRSQEDRDPLSLDNYRPLRHRQRSRGHDANRVSDTTGRFGHVGDLQQALYHPRGVDVWFFLVQTPMLYPLGFIGLFTIGGLTGLFLAALALDVHVTDTYFVIAHFHYIMVGGMVMAFMGGLHYWWPKITGRLYPEFLGKMVAVITFIGFNLTFFPQFLLGYLGMPRRYHADPPEFQIFHVLSTAGASILAIGYLFPLLYFLWSLRYGRSAGPNPWQATGLEWQTGSPPPKHNFEQTPIVTGSPYQYCAEDDRDLQVATL